MLSSPILGWGESILPLPTPILRSPIHPAALLSSFNSPTEPHSFRASHKVNTTTSLKKPNCISVILSSEILPLQSTYTSMHYIGIKDAQILYF